MKDAAARPRCSVLARANDEPLFATAPVSQAWLLLEHPGPWGADALAESSIDPEVASEVNRRSKEHGFRILLVRRSSGRNGGSGRSCFLVRAAQGETWMERLDLADVTDLLDIDPALLANSSAPGVGEPVEHLWAVCTHGRRDPCCAEHGRRLVRLGFTGDGLAEHLWESSHQGGHRFAANLAIFPHGLFYGMVEPDDAERIVGAYRDGRIVLDHYRGRSALDAVAQAADYLARRETGITGIDDLRVRASRQLADGEFEVTLLADDRRLRVRLRTVEGPMRPESCNKPGLTPIRSFEELGVEGVQESPTI
ncbi:MAG TPA: sucrase ferredoxin [Actinomycetota bacterium]|nr:sucrase ferredoxin [Actinomycetota bacterium]